MASFRGNLWFLSNFYPCVINTKSGDWPSAEHLYQATKFTDAEEREKIKEHSSKGLKRFCKTLSSFRDNWNEVRRGFMQQVLKLKFEQHPELLQKLRDVPDSELVELNEWHDVYWGKCVCRIHRGQGENMLGELLKELREGK